MSGSFGISGCSLIWLRKIIRYVQCVGSCMCYCMLLYSWLPLTNWNHNAYMCNISFKWVMTTYCSYSQNVSPEIFCLQYSSHLSRTVFSLARVRCQTRGSSPSFKAMWRSDKSPSLHSTLQTSSSLTGMQGTLRMLILLPMCPQALLKVKPGP